MTDHARDLESVREATGRLLAAATALDNALVTQPSRLPGWSRGHVLAHVSRNADAFVNVLDGRPMYASDADREADIARDAVRPLDEHLADLRASAARFERAAILTSDWSRTLELRDSVTDVASRIPFRRWAEVELHLVDLDVGHELEDLPEEFTQREIAFLAARFAGRPDVPATRLTDTTRAWTTGRDESGPPVVVAGPRAGLLGWLSGRRTTDGLSVTGGQPPALPPL
jgi:maleylpyruvate isomerase